MNNVGTYVPFIFASFLRRSRFADEYVYFVNGADRTSSPAHHQRAAGDAVKDLGGGVLAEAHRPLDRRRGGDDDPAREPREGAEQAAHDELGPADGLAVPGAGRIGGGQGCAGRPTSRRSWCPC